MLTSGYWQPEPGTTWEWQLDNSDDLDMSYNVTMYDVDLFDTPQSDIDKLHDLGKIVICYIDVGTYESWRPDNTSFPSSVKGNPVDGWEGEKWLDIRQWSILGPIMTNRMDIAVNKSCDGMEPDNIDGYTNDNGFNLTYHDQFIYNRNISLEAHKRGLSIGLKNDIDQIDDLEPYFDWALNEQCYQYDECDGYSTFIDSNKAVFGCEYKGKASKFCSAASEDEISRIGKNMDLESCAMFCFEYEQDGNVPSCLDHIS